MTKKADWDLIKKYILLFTAAVVIEVASTFYITSVASKNMNAMIFWAFLGPFLGLPFLSAQIEAKNNIQRVKLAFCYGLGYSTGAYLVSLIN
jgi:hypothetical protein